MAVQPFHVGGRARRSGDVSDVLDTLGRDGGVSVGLRSECTAASLGAPPDDVIVVRVAGEVDLLTGPVLQDALADSLARGPRDLLIDLAAMRFCDVRGLTMLVQARATAAERGVGYAVAAAPRQARRVWAMLWPAAEPPVQLPSAAAGVLAALTRRRDDDLARWALKRGPGWSRHWRKQRLQDVLDGVGDRRATRAAARLIKDGLPVIVGVFSHASRLVRSDGSPARDHQHSTEGKSAEMIRWP